MLPDPFDQALLAEFDGFVLRLGDAIGECHRRVDAGSVPPPSNRFGVRLSRSMTRSVAEL